MAGVNRDLVEWDHGQYEGRGTAEILVERPDWQLFRDGCPGVNYRLRLLPGLIRSSGACEQYRGMCCSFRAGISFGCRLPVGWGFCELYLQ